MRLFFPKNSPPPALRHQRDSRRDEAAALSQEPPAESTAAAQEDAVAAEPESSAERAAAARIAATSRRTPRGSLAPGAIRVASGLVAARASRFACACCGARPEIRGGAGARQPQRNWAQDIQMPIPERGPVSLIPGQTQAQDQRLTSEAEAVKQAEAESEFGLPNGLGEKEEAAVAALAESLARSAAEAMNSEELTTAGDVDFSRLGDEQKAEVTETFANAIQRESGSRDKNPLPTLLDEVFRQDFIRDSRGGRGTGRGLRRTRGIRLRQGR